MGEFLTLLNEAAITFVSEHVFVMVLPWAALLTSPPALISLSPIAPLGLLCAALRWESIKLFFTYWVDCVKSRSVRHCCIVVVQGGVDRIASMLVSSSQGSLAGLTLHVPRGLCVL